MQNNNDNDSTLYGSIGGPRDSAGMPGSAGNYSGEDQSIGAQGLGLGIEGLDRDAVPYGQGRPESGDRPQSDTGSNRREPEAPEAGSQGNQQAAGSHRVRFCNNWFSVGINGPPREWDPENPPESLRAISAQIEAMLASSGLSTIEPALRPDFVSELQAIAASMRGRLAGSNQQGAAPDAGTSTEWLSSYSNCRFRYTVDIQPREWDPLNPPESLRAMSARIEGMIASSDWSTIEPALRLDFVKGLQDVAAAMRSEFTLGNQQGAAPDAGTLGNQQGAAPDAGTLGNQQGTAPGAGTHCKTNAEFNNCRFFYRFVYHVKAQPRERDINHPPESSRSISARTEETNASSGLSTIEPALRPDSIRGSQDEAAAMRSELARGNQQSTHTDPFLSSSSGENGRVHYMVDGLLRYGATGSNPYASSRETRLASRETRLASEGQQMADSVRRFQLVRDQVRGGSGGQQGTGTRCTSKAKFVYCRFRYTADGRQPCEWDLQNPPEALRAMSTLIRIPFPSSGSGTFEPEAWPAFARGFQDMAAAMRDGLAGDNQLVMGHTHQVKFNNCRFRYMINGQPREWDPNNPPEALRAFSTRMKAALLASSGLNTVEPAMRDGLAGGNQQGTRCTSKARFNNCRFCYMVDFQHVAAAMRARLTGVSSSNQGHDEENRDGSGAGASHGSGGRPRSGQQNNFDLDQLSPEARFHVESAPFLNNFVLNQPSSDASFKQAFADPFFSDSSEHQDSDSSDDRWSSDSSDSRDSDSSDDRLSDSSDSRDSDSSDDRDSDSSDDRLSDSSDDRLSGENIYSLRGSSRANGPTGTQECASTEAEHSGKYCSINASSYSNPGSGIGGAGVVAVGGIMITPTVSGLRRQIGAASNVYLVPNSDAPHTHPVQSGDRAIEPSSQLGIAFRAVAGTVGTREASAHSTTGLGGNGRCGPPQETASAVPDSGGPMRQESFPAPSGDSDGPNDAVSTYNHSPTAGYQPASMTATHNSSLDATPVSSPSEANSATQITGSPGGVLNGASTSPIGSGAGHHYDSTR